MMLVKGTRYVVSPLHMNTDYLPKMPQRGEFGITGYWCAGAFRGKEVLTNHGRQI